MSGFKDMIARDIHKVFLNTDEFAEKRTVIYNGETYSDIPVVLESPTQEKRDQLVDDHVQGLRKTTLTMFCALEDLGGKLPGHGDPIQISMREGGKHFKKYYIQTASCDMGMLCLELGATRQ